MDERLEIVERLRSLELNEGSHENLSAICDVICHSDFGWTKGACEALRDKLVRLLEASYNMATKPDTEPGGQLMGGLQEFEGHVGVALPLDADGKTWTGSEARVVTKGGKQFIHGLLWDGHSWRLFRHSADGKNWDTLDPSRCHHEGSFRDIIQKAFGCDATQENEDELVRMCEALAQGQPR